MPKTTLEHQAARRRQILDAAARCFARRGFAETSVRDIYEEAGLSAGSVYVYFESKEQIVEALAARVLTQLGGQLDALAEADDPLSAIENALLFLLATAAAEPQDEIRLRVQAWGAAVTHPRIAAQLANGLARARTTIATALTRAGVGGDADARARAVIALFQGFVLQLTFDRPADPDGYADACVRLLRA